MDAELRQIANGFDFKVHTYEKYHINGYRFRTGMKEQTMPDRKTTNSGVSAIDGGVEYYGIVEEIYELPYYGENPPNAVVFKCHWFDTKDTRRTHEHVGLVEIKQKNRLNVADVYIVAQQATQVFFPFFRLRSDDHVNCYIVECSQDAIQRERQATQEMLSEQLAERERLAEERTQRILEEETARNNTQTKAIYDLFSVSYYFFIYIHQEFLCICLF